MSNASGCRRPDQCAGRQHATGDAQRYGPPSCYGPPAGRPTAAATIGIPVGLSYHRNRNSWPFPDLHNCTGPLGVVRIRSRQQFGRSSTRRCPARAGTMIALCAAVSAKGSAWIDVGAQMSAGSVSARSGLARNRTRRNLLNALRASVNGLPSVPRPWHSCYLEKQGNRDRGDSGGHLVSHQMRQLFDESGPKPEFTASIDMRDFARGSTSGADSIRSRDGRRSPSGGQLGDLHIQR